MAAKLFNPSVLSPADQQAYAAWKQQAQGLLQSGALPAELSYALNHPEYVQQHPELKPAYDVLTGANLPQTVKTAVKSQVGDNVNFDWKGGQAGIAKHGGVWSQPETWIQLALGGTVGGAAAAGAFSGAGVGAGAAPAATAAGGEALPGTAGAASVGGLGPGFGGAGSAAGAGGGLSTTAGAVGAGGGGLGILDALAKYGKYAGLLGAGVSGATQAAANNRYLDNLARTEASKLELANNQLGLSGYEANTAAQNAMQNQMQALAVLEAQQRKTGLSNLYKQSVAQNPGHSPYATGSLPSVSSAYMQAINNLASQASSQIAHSPYYDVANIPKPTYNPYVQPPFTPPTPKGPSGLETAGNIAGPILATIGGFSYLHNNPYA